MSIIIAPSLLSASFGDLHKEIQSAVSAGADWLHVDVMDGNFVPPITFGANMVQLAKKSSHLPIDVHLMVNNPDRMVEDFAAAGAHSITIHQEVSPHLFRSLQSIKSLGVKAGVAINPSTPVESIFPVLEVADIALVMTVNPGWGGQQFIDSMLQKIEKLRDEIKRVGAKTLIEVDGGIDPITGCACLEAGAKILVAGNYIFGSSDRALAVKSLRS